MNGLSITCVEDTALLTRIAEFVRSQQKLFKLGEDSIFKNINPNQKIYPRNGFCSAAIRQLLEYHQFDLKSKEADTIIAGVTTGTRVSKKLTLFFDLDKEGLDVEVTTRTRLGQSYFRKTLTNYGNKCCVTGLNVPPDAPCKPYCCMGLTIRGKE